MLRKIMFYLFGIMTLLSSVGCGLWNKPLKILRMSEGICDPPCWNGITLLETTYEETLQIVEGLDFFNQEGLVRTDEDRVYIDWLGGDGNIASFRFEDGIVYFMEFHLRDNTTLGDVVQTFGDPEYYSIGEGDHDAYLIHVFYPQIGMVFTTGTTISYKFSENMGVWRIDFFPSDSAENFIPTYASYLRKIGKLGIGTEDYFAENFPWEGFGVCPRGSVYESCKD